ncbi:MAG: ABC transporter permease [bacterium]|nr:ABC transporter permease [bacterium]
MVKDQRNAPRGHAALRRKLVRDYRDNIMLFLAIVLLCALGTFCYSGLDATWRMLKLSFDSYYEATSLADCWVNAASITADDLRRIEQVEGVAAYLPRTTLTCDAVGLDDGTELVVHVTDREMAICVPLITEGSMLSPSDRRGCLVDDQFAEANGLHVGDTVTIRLMDEDRSLIIRGVCKASEHITMAKDIKADFKHYSYMYLTSSAVPPLPYTQVLIQLEDGADADQVADRIAELLPSALVATRRSYASTLRTSSDVDMFRNLCKVFPLMAFAVASMVVLTTLTRMMEKQRMQMGTLKALGYSDRVIRRHYLNYALYPSMLGSLLGVFAGRYSLPYILWNMEASHYNHPWQKQAPVSSGCWIIALLCVALCVLICLRTYNRAAHETTAALLRPKPPKAGSRILLERVTFLWRRFSFNTKMIVRNLMRHKGRTFMSLVGILCCNMLIICTLGLTDSINFFIAQYYEGTVRYDTRAELSGDVGTLESYQARLEADAVEGIMVVPASARTEKASRTVQLTVLQEDQTLLCLGRDGTWMPVPRDGAIISEKLASTLGVKVGDTLHLWLQGDEEPISLHLTALADTNLSQSVYLGEKQWDRLRKGAFRPTALLLRNPTDLTRSKLAQMDEVSTILYPSEQITATQSILDSTAVAFSLMSGVALGLAFIICYNMGLMSFTERTRDYATLKVLGYHQKEIRRLMLRENDLTALLGVLLGIPPGVVLTEVILHSCESETMVYASYVSPQSILIASAVTFAFTWLIEWLLTRKVRRIDMVEALKSVE